MWADLLADTDRTNRAVGMARLELEPLGDTSAARRLAEHVRSADDADVARLRPFELASASGLPRRDVLGACLAAVPAGMLGGPARTPHVVAQAILPARGKVTLVALQDPPALVVAPGAPSPSRAPPPRRSTSSSSAPPGRARPRRRARSPRCPKST